MATTEAPALPAPIPRITVTIDLAPHEGRRLAIESDRSHVSPEEYAARLVKRALIRADLRAAPALGGFHNEPRAIDRAGRQLRLAQHIAKYGLPEGEADKRALAEQLGVSQRTMYRDIEVVQGALGKLERDDLRLGGKLKPGPGPQIPGRKPKVKRRRPRATVSPPEAPPDGPVGEDATR